MAKISWSKALIDYISYETSGYASIAATPGDLDKFKEAMKYPQNKSWEFI